MRFYCAKLSESYRTVFITVKKIFKANIFQVRTKYWKSHFSNLRKWIFTLGVG